MKLFYEHMFEHLRELCETGASWMRCATTFEPQIWHEASKDYQSSMFLQSLSVGTPSLFSPETCRDPVIVLQPSNWNLVRCWSLGRTNMQATWWRNASRYGATVPKHPKLWKRQKGVDGPWHCEASTTGEHVPVLGSRVMSSGPFSESVTRWSSANDK